MTPHRRKRDLEAESVRLQVDARTAAQWINRYELTLADWRATAARIQLRRDEIGAELYPKAFES